MTIVGTTTYLVETVYTVSDKASHGLSDIDKHARAAAHSTETLSGVLKGLGAAVLAGSGIHAAKSAFIDFNRTVQDSKISLSAMLEGNYDSTWGQAQKGASNLYSEFQRFSQLTPVTTQEMLEFGQGIAVSTAQAGGSVKDIIKITEQGVVAAKALGAGGAYASLEISEMLQGNVSNRMRFVKQLLGMAHTNEEEFKKLGAKGRLSLVEKVIDSDAMKNATDAMQSSFSGVISTFEDKLQIGLGRAGKALFEKVTAELARWNEWLDRNGVKIDHIVDQVGSGLVKGFEMAKSAVAWIVEHADTLLAIGEVWAGTKLAGKLGSGISGSLSAVGQASGAKIGVGSIGGLMEVGTAAYLATSALMRLTGANDAMLMAIDPHRAKLEQLTKSMQEWDDALEQSKRDLQGKGQTGSTATNTYAGMMAAATMVDREINELNDARQKYLKHEMSAGFRGATQESIIGSYDKSTGYQAKLTKLTKERDSTREYAGLASSQTTASVDAVMKTLSDAQKASIDEKKAVQQVMEEMNRSFRATGFGLSMDRVRAILLGETNAAEKDPFAQGRPNVTNIKIDRVEVAAKDPDRWIQDLDAAAKRRLNGPRGPRAPLRGR